MLKEHNVELDTASRKENKFKVTGLDAQELRYQGKDGPCCVSITFIPLKNNLVMHLLGHHGGGGETSGGRGKIVNSLKPAK
ncbi:MAG TPA: hypothetical protein VK993_02955 [Chthoniobacterales bacterium]|nr:hypothetical protein [Chthoniobacterales bacterium]